MVAEVSIGFWWLAAKTYTSSIRTAASRRPASTSPRVIRPGSSPPKIRSGMYDAGVAPARRVVAGSTA